MGNILFYISAILTIVWGCAHLIPTKSVVAKFGDITRENQLIITMEWIIEGVFLIFIGVLVGTITLVDDTSSTSTLVYFLSADILVVLTVISLLTGFKVNFLPYKICPFIFGLSAALIYVGLTL